MARLFSSRCGNPRSWRISISGVSSTSLPFFLFCSFFLSLFKSGVFHKEFSRQDGLRSMIANSVDPQHVLFCLSSRKFHFAEVDRSRCLIAQGLMSPFVIVKDPKGTGPNFGEHFSSRLLSLKSLHESHPLFQSESRPRNSQLETPRDDEPGGGSGVAPRNRIAAHRTDRSPQA